MNAAPSEVLDAARLGMPVFPCHSVTDDGACDCGDPACDSAGKHPRIAGWQTAATKDPERINAWAAQFPGCNWGMPTGPASGIDVLDVDPRHGGDETLEAVEQANGRLPEGPVGLTGGGGQHLLFAHPAGRYIKSAADVLGRGLDVKGDGGLVIIPPSRHKSGRRYAWNTELHPADMPLPAWPEWALKRVNGAPPAAVGTTVPKPPEHPEIELLEPDAGHYYPRVLRLAMSLRNHYPESVTLPLVLAYADSVGVTQRYGREKVEQLTREAYAKPARFVRTQFDREDPTQAPAETWIPSGLAGVLDPNAGAAKDLIDRLVPRGGVTVIGAAWKVGKTLIVYSLALDFLGGLPVFGRFRVPEPGRVLVFQEEMPSVEDERRLRRLAIGSGRFPEEITNAVSEGRLVWYNGVELDLTSDAGVRQFHETIRRHAPDLVIVDSIIAAFAGADLNDNSTVRKMFRRAFGPLVTEGYTFVLLHHKRKALQGSKTAGDDDKAALLGAQAWGASSGRIYSLDRISKKAGDPADAPATHFQCRLSVTGTWTPTDAPEVILDVRDVKDGTTVRAIDPASREAAAVLTKAQRAALALAKLVFEKVSIEQPDAIALVVGEAGIGERSVKDGLAYAKTKKWIDSRTVEGGKDNRQVLTPGDAIEEAL